MIYLCLKKDQRRWKPRPSRNIIEAELCPGRDSSPYHAEPVYNAVKADKARTNTNFVIISIDPERDTPERLSNFADENNLNNEYWTLLNGSQGDILEIEALLGVRYKRISETGFTHSNMITVLDSEGEIVHRRKQLTDNQSGIIQSIERLLSS